MIALGTVVYNDMKRIIPFLFLYKLDGANPNAPRSV
jgi:hypothetical protein